TGFSAGGFAFTPIAFSGITGFIQLASGFTAADTAVIDGTPGDDTFRFSDSPAFPGFRSAAVNNHTEVFFEGGTIVLRGLAGNDTFNTDFRPAGDTRPIRIEGGDPSASDTVNLSGATGAVTVSLGSAALSTNTTVSGYGSLVTLTGVEVVN